MKTSRLAGVLGLMSLIGGLASGCAAGVRPKMESPTYIAQSAATDCRPSDSSVVCCIKKFPLTAVESCGATAAEVSEVLNGARVLNEAAQQDEPGTADAQEIDDFAHNAHLPEWKQRCIRGYNQCQDDGWTGSCYDCLRRCEGQHEWPTTMCGPRKRSPER